MDLSISQSYITEKMDKVDLSMTLTEWMQEQRKSIMRLMFDFILFISGIYICQIFMAIFQEKLFTTYYHRGKFTFPFINHITMSIMGVVINLCLQPFFNSQNKNVLPWEYKIRLGFFQAGSVILAQSALLYVSYPLQRIIKSSKMIVIVMFNFIKPTGEFVPFYRYCSCFVIGLGIILFSLNTDKSNGSQDNLFGISLCVVSLLFDGMQANTLARAYQEFQPTFYELHLGQYFFAAYFGFVYGIVTNQLDVAIEFIKSDPKVFQDMIIQNFCGACGCFIIIFGIHIYSNIIISMVCQIRKLLTIYISLFLYGHPLGFYKCIGLTLVVTGVVLDIHQSFANKQKQLKQEEMKLQQKKERLKRQLKIQRRFKDI